MQDYGLHDYWADLYAQREQDAFAGPVGMATSVPALLAVESIWGWELHNSMCAALVPCLELAHQLG